jgi:hypothetical protein
MSISARFINAVNILLLILNVYFIVFCFNKYKTIKSLSSVLNSQEQLKNLSLVNFQIESEHGQKVFEMFNEQSQINFYDRKAKFLYELNDARYFYVQSTYSITAGYLDFLSILKQISDQNLVFSISKMSIKSSNDSSPSIFLNFITLVYEKI